MEYPQINMVETGRNIRRLRKAQGITIRELQEFFGFDSPRAIYKWQKGETLPSVDNLFALGVILNAPLESILSARKPIEKEQQTNVCCSFPSQLYFSGRLFKMCQRLSQLLPFVLRHLGAQSENEKYSRRPSS
ncbi:MAG: helix-turn-helix transcriptional regulator [Lachnospiraceae bacterium]|nr:helix-turn-helix transcriptional regulator [Lachnospiraceae bacterium]